MKTNFDHYPLTSVRVLHQRLDLYFERMNVKDWSFLSLSTPIPKASSGVKPHLVLLGDSPYFFSFPTRWPLEGNFYLWTLCSSLRNLLINYVGLPADSVGLISRYDLFPMTTPSYKLSEVDSLIYSGRDVPGKLVSSLREVSHQLGLPLNECGPGLLQDHGQEWVSKYKGRPAFITFSHYRFEDFSVSAAEAQSWGLPVICPYWYGFKNIQGSKDHLLFLKPFPELVLRSQGLSVAKDFWRNQIRSFSGQDFPSLDVRIEPLELSVSTLIDRLSLQKERRSYVLYQYFSNALLSNDVDKYQDILCNMV